MRSVSFPYIWHRNDAEPMIPFEVKFPNGWKTLFAYVDSGSSFTVIRASDAKMFGFDFTKGKEIAVTVGDGDLMPVYLNRMSIKIGHFNFKATLGFSDKLGVRFNLLGRFSIFDRFDVTFSDSRKIVTFKPVDSK